MDNSTYSQLIIEETKQIIEETKQIIEETKISLELATTRLIYSRALLNQTDCLVHSTEHRTANKGELVGIAIPVSSPLRLHGYIS